MLPTKEEVDAILKQINEIRSKFDLPPMLAIVKGAKARCPLERTLSYGSSSLTYYSGVGYQYIFLNKIGVVYDNSIEMCPEAKNFVRDYDDGLIPEMKSHE